MSETYYEVRLSQIPRALEDVVTALCFQHGAEGVSEDLEFHQPEGTLDVQTMEAEYFSARVFFLKPPGEDFRLALQSQDANISLELSEQAQKDWLEEWKKGFEPFQLAEEFWIVPSWFDIPEAAKSPLFIDPGMAFGTGTHETTQLASQALSKYRNAIVNSTVLDVGTGTGVLAILCEQLGASKVVGLEIDEPARQVARENLALNKTQKCEVLDQRLDQVSDVKFDWVVANIIDGILIDLKEDLISRVTDGGYLLVTGIVESRETIFEESFLNSVANFSLVETFRKGEWTGHLLRHSGGQQ